jgi:MFS family permease
MRGGSSTPPNTPAVDGDDDPSSHDSLSPLRSPLRSAVAPREDEDEALPDDIPETSKSSVFTALLFAQVLVYAEAGAIPALLDRLSAAFSLTYYQQGLLGGVVYVGISLGAPFASFAYHKYEPKSVLMVSLLLNLISVIFFGLTPESWPLALTGARFLIGVTQSFLAIFCPVWVDVYASRSKQTQWFSGLQASVPIGIMVGYLLGYAAIWIKAANEGDDECFGGRLDCWRLPFIVQAILTVPLVVRFSLMSKASLNIGKRMREGSLGANEYNEAIKATEKSVTNEGLSRVRSDSAFIYGAEAAKNRTCAQSCSAIGKILSRLYFSVTVFTLTALYFVVTSVQFWATEYLITSRGYDSHKVMLAFIITSASAPILGVLFGGWIVDRIGGYRGGTYQRFRCCSLLLLFGVFANVFADFSTYWHPPKEEGTEGLLFVIGMIWLLLFFGGACLPALTGIFIDAVPSQFKALGSSMSQICFNCGYAAAPIFAGLLMTNFQTSIDSCDGLPPGTCPAALEWGFRVSLFMSGIAFIGMLLLWFHSLTMTPCWTHRRCCLCRRHGTDARKAFPNAGVAGDARWILGSNTSQAEESLLRTPVDHYGGVERGQSQMHSDLQQKADHVLGRGVKTELFD